MGNLFGRIDQTLGLFAFGEWLVAFAIVLAAWRAPKTGLGFFAAIERRFLALKWTAGQQVLAIGLLSVLARALLLPWLGEPAPGVHDEQSLLLQAQTYLTGHLANPSHPLWEHFETFHVNQLPAYASMYFPGRGAPLALGLLLAHDAWIGVWITMALMCMAAVWMLQAWVSLPLAFLGGLLVVARLGVFSYWINSFWGGAFTALGAMLVVGTLPRVLAGPRWSHGVLLGVGAAILMTTRPYEGLLLCIPVAGVVLAGLFSTRARSNPAGAWARVLLPPLLLLAAAGALMLQYNLATTGSASQTAYELNRQTYAAAPAFLISAPIRSQERGPAYFRDFYKAEAASFERRGSPREIVRAVVAKVYYSWNFYVGPILTAAFVMGLWASRRQKVLLFALVFFFGGYVLETWNFPHYTAPIFPVVFILTMRGFDALRGWEWRGRPTGLFLTRAMPMAVAAMVLLPLSAVVAGWPAMLSNVHSNPCCAISTQSVRADLAARLDALPGPDLVIVKDGPANPLHYELVENAPLIDRAPIVWARSLSPEKDAALLAYFAGRRVWEFTWDPAQPEGYRMRERASVNGAPAAQR
jgi:hypothetical protein